MKSLFPIIAALTAVVILDANFGNISKENVNSAIHNYYIRSLIFFGTAYAGSGQNLYAAIIATYIYLALAENYSDIILNLSKKSKPENEENEDADCSIDSETE